MTQAERAVYLANVLSIAMADGAVTPEEATVLAEVARRVEAGDAEMAQSRRLVAGGYTLRLLRDPEQRGHNIEDMVLMALADGALNPAEAGPLEQLLGGLGYSQADMDMMVKRARGRLRTLLQAPPAVPAPAGRPAARPLRARNTPAPDAPAARPPPPPPVEHASAPATPASSSTPPRATEAASAVRQPSPPAAPSLAQPAPAITDPAVDASAAVPACAREREASGEPACYCFGVPGAHLNVWGCRLLRMDWSEGADWLSLGAFRDGDTFVFDKPAIGETLDARLEQVRACPHLRPDVARAALAELPSRASVWGRWRRNPAKAGSARAVPLAVREYRQGCEVSATAVCDGMAPVDDGDAVRVILAVARRLGLAGVTRKGLARQA